jgi:hypothetical protein
MNYKPTAFAKLFDASTSEYDKLDQAGVMVVLSSDHFDVVGPNGETIVNNIGLNKGVVGIAQSGNLPGIAKAPVAAAIGASFKHALKTNNWAHEVTADDMTDDGDIQLTSDDIETPVFDESNAFEPSMQKVVGIGVPVNVGEPVVEDGSTLPKVKLTDAVAMYQPVKSTSQGSTYVLVGIAGDLKFAARRKDQSLSIRVEGPVSAAKAALVAAGFNEEYITKGYTSVHFHGIDSILAQRTIGAVLMGTGLQFSTPLPNMAKVGGE